jgi:beta-lactamase regulating signal transducer with metallopeptidase domain
MTAFLSGGVALVIEVSWKAALLAAIAAVGLKVLRVRNKVAQHRVWTAVLMGMIALPLLVQITPGLELPAWIHPSLGRASDQLTGIPDVHLVQNPELPAAVRDSARRSPSRDEKPHNVVSLVPNKSDGARLDGISRPSASLPDSTRAPSAVGASRGWASSIFVIYAVGVVFFALRLIAAQFRAHAIAQSATPIRLSRSHARLVGGTVVRASPAVRVPLTVGCRRPSILLPSDWNSWSESLLESALRHEQAHVRRRDPWVAMLAEWNRAIYWFHPVAWFLRRQLSALAESACDDAVIAATGDRTAYARDLLDVAGRLMGERRRLQPSGMAMARMPRIERRINAILDANRPLSHQLGIAGVLAILVLMIPLMILAAGLKADEKQRADDKPPTEEHDTQRDWATAATAAAPENRQLRGRVVMEADGRPAPKAEVRLTTWTDDRTRRDIRTAFTNELGEFAFSNVQPGDHQIAAFLDEYSSRKTRYKGQPVDLSSNEPVVLTLSKMPTMAVRVVSKADGQPVADALVRLTWTDTDHDHRTDDDGRVLLRGLSPEVWHIEVQAKGFAEHELPVNLAGTDAANVTVELEPGSALFGTITDEAGKPIAGAGFSVFPEGHRGGQIEYLRTDAQGRYRFDFLPVGQRLELHVSHLGCVPLREHVNLRAGPNAQRQLDLVLKGRPHGGTVSGAVSDAHGNPIAGATITNHGRSSREVRSATTDEFGVFLLDDVYEGSIGHELVVKAPKFAPQRVRFTPGTPDAPGKVAIELEPGHRIRGRVVDEAGKPIRGVGVYFADGNRGSGMEFGGKATTDADGRFEFDSLPTGSPFNLVANGYSEIEGTKLPLDGDEEVVVTMRAEGVIKGRVVDAETGNPISPFNVRITFSPDRRPDEPGHSLSGPRATSPEGEQFATPDGAFVLADLIRDMPLQVTVLADGYENQVERRIVAQSAANAETAQFRMMRLDASKNFTISGRIVNESEEPISGVELRLISAREIRDRRDPREISFVEYPFGWQMIQNGGAQSVAGIRQLLSTTSGKDGEFSFEQVQPAAAMQIAYWGDGVSQGRLQELEKLPAGERERIKIVAVTPATVRGTIDRNALPEATAVSLGSSRFDQDLASHEAHLSADDTTYEIRNVPPGKYELQVYGQRIRSQRTDGFTYDVVQRHKIELKAGQTLMFDLGAADAE